MLIVKSCKAKDNFKIRQTLKLGTLNEYQTSEEKQIADKHEGYLFFSINLKGEVIVDIDWSNMIFAGYSISEGELPVIKRFPGRLESKVHRFEHRLIGDGKAVLIDSSATIHR